MTKRAALRHLIAAPELLVAPGAWDGLTARLVEQAGFQAVYMTGAGTAAAHGFPDYGLVTGTEMAANAGRMADCTTIPLIADADTGYGNELNVTRSVRDYERAGVAALHIEDQVAPKRCGHLDGKQVIPADEFAGKIRAAAQARRDPDLVIIARTDARAVADLDEAVARANAALDAGADLIFVEAIPEMAELAAVPQRVHGPCLLNVVPGGKTPPVDLRTAQAMGYAMAICPGVLLTAVLAAGDRALADLKAAGLPTDRPDAGVVEVFRRFGSGEWDALRRGYAGTAA
ncbi:oxaloacetate decarboxylase [Tistrella mobilis]|uniref:isocitrate lyase/PEP mutase family protein n=1 Tax=Tistrella mobilis TaxID=171437 RepID=UPI0035571EC0